MDKMISIFAQVKLLFTTVYGWFLLTLTMIWEFIAPEKFSFALVLGAIGLDLIWGIIVAKYVKKEYITSFALKETFKKLAIYGSSLFLILAIERTLHQEWFIGFRIACAIAASCELISVSASMLMVKPNMPFLKIFTFHLKGEISKKLGVNVDECFNDEKQTVKDKQDGTSE